PTRRSGDFPVQWWGEGPSRMQNPAEQLRAVLEHPYEKETCFLCACALNNANRSDEHVIPRWLQREFNLWDQRLTLLNDTDIPYRQLTIPCCTRCNNETFAPLEAAFARPSQPAFKQSTNSRGLTSSAGSPRFFSAYSTGICFSRMTGLYQVPEPSSTQPSY